LGETIAHSPKKIKPSSASGTDQGEVESALFRPSQCSKVPSRHGYIGVN
jgi:hypothetical protein